MVGGEGTAAYGQYENWDNENFSRVHELELILELTADYEGMANSCEDGNADDACSDIPEQCYLSATGQCHDWRIGHGLTNVDAAVALARTLELMRDQDGNGIVDHPEYNVWDAWEIYENMMTEKTISLDTDRVRHSWKGDWNHFNNGDVGALYYTEDSHYVWIPNGTTRLEAMFTATEFELDSLQAGSIQLEIDLGEDGSNDQGQGNRIADTWYYDLDVDSSHWGKWTHFDVSGQAMTILGIVEDQEFFESRIPYTVDVILTLDLDSPVDISFEQRPDFYSDLDPTSPSDEYDSSMDGMLTFTRNVYDQQTIVGMITPKLTNDDSSSEGFFSALGNLFAEHGIIMTMFSIIILLSAAGVGYVIRSSKETSDDKDYQVSVEAELIDED